MPQTLQKRVRNESLAVGTTSVQVSEVREVIQNERVAYTLRNSSPNAIDIITISLGFDKAVAGAGIVLAQGASFGESDDLGYKCHKGAIQAVCATANGVLSIMER
jgi:hypothetical protein